VVGATALRERTVDLFTEQLEHWMTSFGRTKVREANDLRGLIDSQLFQSLVRRGASGEQGAAGRWAVHRLSTITAPYRRTAQFRRITTAHRRLFVAR